MKKIRKSKIFLVAVLVNFICAGILFGKLNVARAEELKQPVVPPLSDEIVLNGKWNVKDKNVYLTWKSVKTGVKAEGYNIYIDDKQVNTKLVKTNEFTYAPKSEELDKVHKFKVNAVNAKETTVLSSNVKKIGFTSGKKYTPTKEIKIPVSDIASELEYIGPLVSDERYDFWCTSIVEDNGKYHLFTARWDTRMNFYPAWHCICEIAHYVSDSIDGPYEDMGVVFSTENLYSEKHKFSAPHNIQVSKCDGKWVMVFITQDKGDKGTQAPSVGIQRVMMAVADDINGPWTLANENGVVVEHGNKATNPAFIKVGDEYRIYYKREAEGADDFSSVTYMLATSSQLEGPYIKQGRVLENNAGVIEDATLFYEQNKLLMVVQDFQTSNSGGNSGVLWASEDGVKFTGQPKVAFGALNQHVTLPEGWNYTHQTNHQMERPCVIYENGIPQYLAIACRTSVDGVGNSHSYLFKIHNPSHKVTVNKKLTGGKITLNYNSAKEFEEILVNIEPEKGMKLKPESLKIKYKEISGKTVEREKVILPDNENSASFTMPAADCEITAEFIENVPENTVGKIQLTPSQITMAKSEQQKFVASVFSQTGQILDSPVQWSLAGNKTIDTKLDQKGNLKIGTYETAEYITVVAQSKENASILGTAMVSIKEPVEKNNLAEGLPKESYTASSSFSNKNGTVVTGPEHAFDGNSIYTDLNHIWTPKNDDDNYWVQVDFGKPIKFNEIVVYDYGGQNNNCRVTGVTVQGSDDGEHFQDIKTVTFDANDPKKTVEFPSTTNRYVRLANFETSTTSKPHILEVGVYCNAEAENQTLEITPNVSKITKGATQQFALTDKNIQESEVQWSLVGEYVEGTGISEQGLLTVSENETSSCIRIRVERHSTQQKAQALVEIIDDSSTQKQNLALGKPEGAYTASSTFDNGNGLTLPVKYAFDGITEANENYNRWGSGKGQEGPHWLQVDFGEDTKFNQIVIHENTYQRVKQAKLMGSVTGDENDWVDIQTFEFNVADNVKKMELSQDAQYRYLRVVMEGEPAEKEINIEELEVFYIPKIQLKEVCISNITPSVQEVLTGIVVPTEVDESKLSYEWYVDGQLKGTEKTYVVVPEDVDKQIKVKVTYEGNSIESEQTDFVRNNKTEQENVLESLEIVSNPEKMGYCPGERFERKGMVVNGIYSDGTQKEITNFMVIPDRSLKLTDQKVIICYGGKQVELLIKVSEDTPEPPTPEPPTPEPPTPEPPTPEPPTPEPPTPEPPTPEPPTPEPPTPEPPTPEPPTPKPPKPDIKPIESVEMIEGTNNTWTQGGKEGLSFTSNAELEDFIKIEVDGILVDNRNYTVEGPNTTITLKSKYLQTLTAGTHKICIVSKTGVAKAEFTVTKMVEENNITHDGHNRPSTGDHANILVWIVIDIVMLGTITTIFALKKRK